jgi:hypothetical protein
MQPRGFTPRLLFQMARWTFDPKASRSSRGTAVASETAASIHVAKKKIRPNYPGHRAAQRCEWLSKCRFNGALRTLLSKFLGLRRCASLLKTT